MKIRMLTSLAGVDYALSPGEVTERFDDAEAARLVQADYAVVVIDDVALATMKPGETVLSPVQEAAILPPPAETAVAPPVAEAAVVPPAEVRADDDAKAALVAEAEALGIDVDGRWSVRRLKLEIANAKAGGAG